MKADGTEPRRLARGGWPSWSRDSTRVYYQSRLDSTLCSISIAGSRRRAETDHGVPRCLARRCRRTISGWRIWKARSLKVKDLASQALVAQWPVPLGTWGGPAWSPDGQRTVPGRQRRRGEQDRACGFTALDSKRTRSRSWTVRSRRLPGPRMARSSSSHLGPPYFEIWTADLDPNVSTVEALGPAQTLDEHFAGHGGPLHPQNRDRPAGCLRLSPTVRGTTTTLHERTKAEADMRRWSAVMSGRSPSDLRFGAPWTFGVSSTCHSTVNSSFLQKDLSIRFQ